jgi:hypothetical protein
MSTVITRLEWLLTRGLFLPAAREHAKNMLAIAERRACQRTYEPRCANGCTARVVTTSPRPLCAECREVQQ